LWLQVLLLLTLSFSLMNDTRAGIEGIPELSDLSAVGSYTTRKDLPLLLVFTADDCAFCDRLAEEVLIPMLRSGEYDDRMVVLAVNLSRSSMIDFEGQIVVPWDFAKRHYDVMVTPTAVVMDHRGAPLAKPLVGLGPTEYYETRITDALEEALTNRGLSASTAPASHKGVSR